MKHKALAGQRGCVLLKKNMTTEKNIIIFSVTMKSLLISLMKLMVIMAATHIADCLQITACTFIAVPLIWLNCFSVQSGGR